MKRGGWAKLGIGVAGMVPLALVTVRLVTDQLGANPIEALLNSLGFWALVMLLASLAPTAIQIVSGWKWPLRLRRMLGLEAFTYAFLHFATYLVLDQFFAWSAIFEDIVERKFITVGFVALLLLVPLAVTSTDKMVKRLGFVRWKRLHRIVYFAATLGVIHFVWRVKADYTEPVIFATVLTVLLGVRVVAWARDRRSSPRPA